MRALAPTALVPRASRNEETRCVNSGSSTEESLMLTAAAPERIAPPAEETLEPIIVTRPSRRPGHAGHQVSVNPVTLLPDGCTCEAGRHGELCWATIDVLDTECRTWAWDRWSRVKGLNSTEFTEAVKVMAGVLRALKRCGHGFRGLGRAA